MWIVIGLIGFIVAGFIVDRSRDKEKISTAGGVQTVYRKLIQLIMEGQNNTKVVSSSSNQVIIQARGRTTTVKYKLLWAFDALTIVYSIESPMTGYHSFEEVYRGNISDEAIYESLCDRIHKMSLEMGI